MMARTITFVTEITLLECDDIALDVVKQNIAKTDAIYFQLIDKTVKVDEIKLIEIAEGN
jgi:hypothetical protein